MSVKTTELIGQIHEWKEAKYTHTAAAVTDEQIECLVAGCDLSNTLKRITKKNVDSDHIFFLISLHSYVAFLYADSCTYIHTYTGYIPTQ